MSGIKEVAEGIFRIHVDVPGTLLMCTVYLIRSERGALIEPGPARIAPTILGAMKDLGMRDLAYIIPTHVHLDHAGGTAMLAEAFPKARVVVHPLGKDHLVDTSRLVESTKKAYGDDFEKCYGPISPLPVSRVDTASDGEVIPFENRPLRVVYSPGHAPHHISVLDIRTGGLFCGEALGMRAKSAAAMVIPNAAPPAFDIEAYLETINKLGSMKPRMLFYSHDGVGRNPEELIQAVATNTKVVGEVILRAIREGQDFKSIRRTVEDFYRGSMGIDPKELGDITVNIKGFIHYFEKKGLV